MPNDKPFVAAAFFAEHILKEADGVSSAIRIVDRFKLRRPPGLPEGQEIGLPLSMFITLKSGDVRGESEVGLRMRSPDGEERDLNTWPILLNGDNHGVAISIKMLLGVSELGLYWFDVLWNGERLTSVPLMLIEESEPEPEPERKTE